MNKLPKIALIAFLFVFTLSGAALAQYKYQVKEEHCGGNVSPVEAHVMLVEDKAHTFLVDVRTRPEYQMIGHAEGAYNIPIKFFSTEIGKKGYQKIDNPNFGKDLLARFNPETDTLLFMCRSGGRSCGACEAAVKAGFDPKKVFNVMGGFEGGKQKYKQSIYCGQRIGGSWRTEGLPWTYHMDKDLMYAPDLAE